MPQTWTKNTCFFDQICRVFWSKSPKLTKKDQNDLWDLSRCKGGRFLSKLLKTIDFLTSILNLLRESDLHINFFLYLYYRYYYLPYFNNRLIFPFTISLSKSKREVRLLKFLNKLARNLQAKDLLRSPRNPRNFWVKRPKSPGFSGSIDQTIQAFLVK